MSDVLVQVLPLLILVPAWAYFKWFHNNADPRVQTVGEVKSVAVDVFAPDEGPVRVRVTFPGQRMTVNAMLSPQQARVLAEWMRIAGTPGKTLDLARIAHQQMRAAHHD